MLPFNTIPDMPAKKRVQALVSLYRKGRFKEVISRGTRMVKQSPDAVFVLNLVGSAHAGLCHPETAAALFKKATKLAPSYSNAHHNLGLAHMQMQNPAEAIVSFKIAISLEPNNIEFNNSLGTAFVANKEPEKAVEVFHTAVQRNPENSTLQKNLGQAYLVLGKPKEALAPFRAIAKANPDDLGMLISLAELLTKLNMPSDSMECIKAAARIAPENPNVYLTLGRFWEKQEDFEKAIQAYDRALTFDEGNTEVESTRAYALIAHGEPKRAIEGYERILNIWPDDNEARHFLSALKGEITETAPSEYVAGLFDSYAATFEASLVETLEYQTPQKLAAFLIANSPIGQRFSTTLDLGCGTGLFGQALAGITDRLVGVDLSEKMIAVARGKNIYESLEVSDLIPVIKDTANQFDLYVSADVLVYVGNLEKLFSNLKANAAKGAKFLFSTEHQQGRGYSLLSNGRYSHSFSYVQDLCEKHQMTLVSFETSGLRKELGEMLLGGHYLVSVN